MSTLHAASTPTASKAPLDVVALAQALIRCPSVTPHDAGVMAILEPAVRQAGFADVEVFQANEAGTQHTVQNLVAHSAPAAAGPSLAFAGHVDVVPPNDLQAWDDPPFAAVIRDGVLYGRGAVDMKSSIAAFVVAAQRFLAAPQKPAGVLSLLITGDEEVGSPQGTRAIIARLQQTKRLPDVCLIGEASNEGFLGQGMRIGRRGSLNTTVQAHGVQGHVAWPHQAVNAAHLLLDYLQRLRAQRWGAAVGIFPASNLEIVSIDVGNPSTNVIPAHASAKFNIRFNGNDHAQQLIDTLQGFAQQLNPARLQVDCQLSGEPYVCDAPLLVAAISRAVQNTLQHTPQQNAGGGVSDGRFLHLHCPVVEFGLIGDMAHKTNESTPVRALQQLTTIYEAVLWNYFSAAAAK